MAERRRALVGLGSNLGPRWATLAGALADLALLDPELRCSSVYESAPVGGPADQGRFLNLVVSLQSDLDPYALLGVAHRLEHQAGRVRTVVNGPRTLDVDLLYLEGVTLDDEELTLPHPRAAQRAFVLAPTEDVARDLVSPGWRERLGAAAGPAAIRRAGAIIVPAPPSRP
jgi:2-amino-4-hydroxy-6-hydroxymethyldihydropteridine diphosphokinase